MINPKYDISDELIFLTEEDGYHQKQQGKIRVARGQVYEISTSTRGSSIKSVKIQYHLSMDGDKKAIVNEEDVAKEGDLKKLMMAIINKVDENLRFKLG